MAMSHVKIESNEIWFYMPRKMWNRWTILFITWSRTMGVSFNRLLLLLQLLVLVAGRWWPVRHLWACSPRRCEGTVIIVTAVAAALWTVWWSL